MFLLAQAAEFPEQVTTNQLLQNVVYASGTVGALMVVVGLIMLDAGGVRRANVFNATIEKLVGFFIGFATYFLIGFALWNWQYNVAFEVENRARAVDQGLVARRDAGERPRPERGSRGLPRPEQLPDLHLLPGLLRRHHQHPAPLRGLGAHEGVGLLHHLLRRRDRLLGAQLPTWGSVGPLTNAGFHDFFGAGFVYLFPAGMALVFVLRLGRRPGMFEAHPKLAEYRTGNLWTLATGVLLIFAGLPMVILSCLFFFDPEALAVSVTMADTSVGIALNNYALAWAGGALTGALIAYRTKKYAYLLLGPFAGYVSGAPALDVYEPWQAFLVALGAPFVAYAVYEFIGRKLVDEHKLLPVFAGGRHLRVPHGRPDRVGHGRTAATSASRRGPTPSRTPRSTSSGS